MKRLLLSLLLGAATCACAQDRSFGSLPLVEKPNGRKASGADFENTSKYRTAKNIYDKLVAARGDFRDLPPRLVLSDAEDNGALMAYHRQEIILEQKAFDVCAQFGPDSNAALAFVLGHELTHYYEKHGWRADFADEYRNLSIGKQLDTLIDKVTNETQADYLGGFLAYSAGYGLFEKGSEVIQKLYDTYSLDSNMRNYPSLADRKALSVSTAKKLEGLVDVFEMANMLVLVGNFEEALMYYRYVLTNYQSREIYNNVGVTSVFAALRLFKDGDVKYSYPVQLDLQASGGKGGDESTRDKREKLLRQALLHFDAAISLDPNYAPAYLNKACAYAFLRDPAQPRNADSDDTRRARFFAEEARIVAREHPEYKKTGTDADILLGILKAEEDTPASKKAAESIFQTATGSSELAKINLYILQKGTYPKLSTPASAPSGEESIDDQTLGGVGLGGITDPDAEGYHTFDVTRHTVLRKNRKDVVNLTFDVNPKQGENSKLLYSNDDVAKTESYFHMTGPGYTCATCKTARGIRLGDRKEAIVKAYGDPKRTYETPFGQILMYQSPDILFILNAGQLERWVNYRIVVR